MSSTLFQKALRADIERFFEEDDLKRNLAYINELPDDLVSCSLKLKDDMVVSGLPFFVEVFNFLGANLDYSEFEKYEGISVKKDDKKEIHFQLPFSIALTGERIALNLLQRSSGISTYTKKYTELAAKSNVRILDTRKTTPGLRSLEKYAVRAGGGFNHRLGPTDMWMVKDNHKSFFGGVKEAVQFFQNLNGFYTPIEVEIHDIEELKEVVELNVRHLMLDNFSPELVKEAISIKKEGVTYEVSGGVTLDNIENYLINGVDAISIGALTYKASNVDISLKYKRS